MSDSKWASTEAEQMTELKSVLDRLGFTEQLRKDTDYGDGITCRRGYTRAKKQTKKHVQALLRTLPQFGWTEVGERWENGKSIRTQFEHLFGYKLRVETDGYAMYCPVAFKITLAD